MSVVGTLGLTSTFGVVICDVPHTEASSCSIFLEPRRRLHKKSVQLPSVLTALNS